MTGTPAARNEVVDAGLSPGYKEEIQRWLGIEMCVDRGRKEA